MYNQLMKRFNLTAILLFIPTLAYSIAPKPNVLIIDSSFTPITFESKRSTDSNCLLINENNIEISKKWSLL